MATKRPVVNYSGKLKEIATGDTLPFSICQIILQDEGSNVATGNTINATGAGVTASNVGGVLTLNIPGGGGSTPTVQTLTGATSLSTSKTYSLCDVSAGGFTVTLPTAVGNSGLEHYVKKIDSSGNALTIATTSSQTIDGSTTATIIVTNLALTLVSNGANWYLF
jgi:hypothetical protein